MTTFVSQPISPAGFSGIRTRLIGGIGFFQDGPYFYVVFDSDVYRADVVRRTSGSDTFSSTVAALPSNFKVVINGQYFAGIALYPRGNAGIVDPSSVHSVGDVRQGGSVIEPGNSDGPDFFFFGRDNSTPPVYLADKGNPPASVFEGMGGLGPIILTNPTTGAPMKFGVGDIYASDPKKNGTTPKTPADFQDLVQRNNKTYISIQNLAQHGEGFAAIAIVPKDKLLIAVAKPNRTPATIDALRDGFLSIGVTLACFTDGSTSTSLAVDGVMEPNIKPASFKDNLIETGIGFFRYKPVPPTNVRVLFTALKIIDDGFTFGDGEWTVTATVLSSSLPLLTKTRVASGTTVRLNLSIDVTVPSGADLRITTTGLDERGLDDDVGSVDVHFGAVSSPPFGAGTHTQTSSTKNYELTFVISILP